MTGSGLLLPSFAVSTVEAQLDPDVRAVGRWMAWAIMIVGGGACVTASPGHADHTSGRDLDGVVVTLTDLASSCERVWSVPVPLSGSFLRRVSIMSNSDSLLASGFVAREGSSPTGPWIGVLRELDFETGAVLAEVDHRHLPAGGKGDLWTALGTTIQGASSADEMLIFAGAFSANAYSGAVGLIGMGQRPRPDRDGHAGDDSGASPELRWTFEGSEKEVLGSDLAIGVAPSRSAGVVLWASAPGFMGDHRSTPAKVRAFDVDSNVPLYVLQDREGFGNQLQPLCDIDADGHDDLLIGSRMRSVPAQDGGGLACRLLAVSGKDGSVLWDVMQIAGRVRTALASGRDFDGDGLDDVLMALNSAPPPAGHGPSVVVLSARDGTLIKTIEPSVESDSAFTSLACASGWVDDEEGLVAVGFERSTRSDSDSEGVHSSGLLLVAAGSGRVIGRLELADATRRIGETVVVVPLSVERGYAVVVSIDAKRPREGEPRTWLQRYDLHL